MLLVGPDVNVTVWLDGVLSQPVDASRTTSEYVPDWLTVTHWLNAAEPFGPDHWYIRLPAGPQSCTEVPAQPVVGPLMLLVGSGISVTVWVHGPNHTPLFWSNTRRE